MKERRGSNIRDVLIHCQFSIKVCAEITNDGCRLDWLWTDTHWAVIVCQFPQVGARPNQIASVLSALSWRRREAHHCATSVMQFGRRWNLRIDSWRRVEYHQHTNVMTYCVPPPVLSADFFRSCVTGLKAVSAYRRLIDWLIDWLIGV